MQTNIYLNFPGTAEEAFEFYRSIFGGEFLSLMRFSDTPQAAEMPEGDRNKIMHMGLSIGPTKLMASDALESLGQKVEKGNNMFICLTPDSLEDTHRFYTRLSEGGEVEMPLEKMFWGSHFASFTDKYGIRWMIDFPDSN